MTKEADEALVALKARRAVRGELEQAAPSSQSCDRGQLVCFGGNGCGECDVPCGRLLFPCRGRQRRTRTVA